MTQQTQTRASEPPVLRSKAVQGQEGGQTSLALWAKYDTEPNKPHVTGKFQIAGQDGATTQQMVSGYFKMDAKGSVRLDLSTRNTTENRYEQVGSVYINDKGFATFYPKNKALQKMSIEATSAMSQEVVEALGISPPVLALQNEGVPRAATPTQVHMAPTVQAEPPKPDAAQRAASEQPQAAAVVTTSRVRVTGQSDGVVAPERRHVGFQRP